MKILLLGTHGQFNFGDEILLETFLAQLGPDQSYTVNSYTTEDTQKRHEEQYKISVFHTVKGIFSLPFRIFKNDVIFFGGGSILKELYKSIGRNKYSSLCMVLGVVGFAKLIAGKKVVMSNIGIGQVNTRFGKLLVKMILSMVDHIYLRDRESEKRAVDCGVPKKRITVVPDAVFARTRESFGLSSAKQHSSRKNKVLKVGLNLNFDIANPDNWVYFTSTLKKALQNLSLKQKIELYAIPMQTAFNENDDVTILKKFFSEIPEITSHLTIPQSTTELAQLIDSCDLVLAERLHTLVMCSIIGTPFVGLSYDVKVDSLLKQLGMKDNSVNINTEFRLSSLENAISYVVENADAVRSLLQEKRGSIHIKALKYFSQLRKKIGIDSDGSSKDTKSFFKKIFTSHYTIVFGLALVLNFFIFRGLLLEYPDVIAGNSTTGPDELVPIFDFQTQFVDQLVYPLSELTNNFEFRVRYSLLSTWGRYYLFLPFTLIIFNSISLLLFYISIYSVNIQFFEKAGRSLHFINSFSKKMLQVSSIGGASVLYLILAYSKITHFYTLILGNGLFAISLSLILYIFGRFEEELFPDMFKKAFLVVLLSLINPATHYVVLTVFFIAVMIFLSVVESIVVLVRNRVLQFNWLKCVTFIATAGSICVGYVLYYYVFVTGMGSYSVIGSVGFSRRLLEDTSSNIIQILSLQTGSIVDFFQFNFYQIDPGNRIFNVLYSLALFALPFIFLRKKLTQKAAIHTRKMIAAIIGSGLIAIFFALGFTTQFSAHSATELLLSYIGDSSNPLIQLIVSVIITFFNVLRFPHRFLFLYHIFALFGATLAFSYVLLRVERYAHFAKSKLQVVFFGLALLIFVSPFVVGNKVFTTLASGNYGGFFSNYTFPEDIKSIKNYLQNNQGGKLLVLPSSEIPYRETLDEDGDEVKFIDKFFIYYLNYPSLYYGLSGELEDKVLMTTTHLASRDQIPWFNIHRNKGVEYILVNKKQFIKNQVSYRNSLEGDIQRDIKLLETQNKVTRVITGDSFDLYKLHDEYVEEKPPIYINTSWDFFVSQVLTDSIVYPNNSIHNLNEELCNQDEFIIKGEYTKSLQDIATLCLNTDIEYPYNTLAFQDEIESSREYLNTAFSMMAISDSPRLNRYNEFQTINPGSVFNSLDKNMILLQPDQSITMVFDNSNEVVQSYFGRIKLVEANIQSRIRKQGSQDNIYESTKGFTNPQNTYSNDGFLRLSDFQHYPILPAMSLEKGSYEIDIINTGTEAFVLDTVVVQSDTITKNIAETYVITPQGVDMYNFKRK